MNELGADALARYHERLDTSAGPDACWPWPSSSLGTHGYGVFYAEGRQYLAHRIALEQRLGRSLSPHEEARHDCDYKPCCNPAHLRPGTHAENMQDAADRGRSAPGRSMVQVCPAGHAIAEDKDVYIYEKRHPRTGKRYTCRTCRQCNRDRLRLKRALHRKAVATAEGTG